jgi:hypothetical protein
MKTDSPMKLFNELYLEVFPEEQGPVFFGAEMQDVHEAQLKLVCHYILLMKEKTKE